MLRHWLTVGLLAGGLPGAAHATAPRPVDATAWTVPEGSARLDLGVGGTTPYELGVLAGTRAGVADGLQLGSNVAHAVLGMADLHLKLTALDGGDRAVALTGGLMWFDLGRAAWLPPVDPAVDEALRGVDILVLPLGVVGSWELEGAGLDLGLGWDQVWMTGRPSSEVLVLDGAVGVRRAWMAPAVRLPLSERLTLGARVTLPLLALGRAVATAEYRAEDGLLVGLRTADWFPLPFGLSTTARAFVEWRLEDSQLRLGASTSALHRAVGLPVLPYLLWSRSLGW